MKVFKVSLLNFSVVLALASGQLSCSGDPDVVSGVVEPEVEEDSTDVTDSVDGAHNFGETAEPSGSIFDPGRVIDVKLSIAYEDWNQLRFEHRKPVEFFGDGCREPIPDAFNYYPANVEIDNTALGQVGLRTKGLIGSINPARPSLKVKLQEYQDDLYYQERKRFTLNNQTSDPARLSTCMAYYIFRKMGVPASRCNFARVQVNDDQMGVYANVEPIKKPMLERLFGDDSGNLYEGTVADIRPGFTARVEKKTNEDEDDWSDFEALLDAVQAPDETFLYRIEEVLDIDAFLRFTAATVMVGHWDSFPGNANNYYFYRDPGTDKFYFLPWGPDDTFSNRNLAPNGRIQVAMGGALLARRLFSYPVIMTRYRDMMRTMLTELWDDQEILGELSRMESLIREYVVGQSSERHAESVDNVRRFLVDRKQRLLNAVNADPIPLGGSLPAGPVCLQYSGPMDVSFRLTWDTLGAENPFATSSGTLDANYGGIPFVAQALGALAGEIGSPGATELDLIGFLPDSQILFVRLMLPTSAFVPNSSFDMGDPRVSSLMFLIGANGGGQIFGFLGGGELTFGDEVDLVPGGTVAGDLSVDMWGGLPAVE